MQRSARLLCYAPWATAIAVALFCILFALNGDDFARDYRGLAPDGNEWPALDVWVKRDGKLRHFWAGEMGGTEDPGQDARGAAVQTAEGSRAGLAAVIQLRPAPRYSLR